MTPCSAAIVTGIVCEAAVARAVRRLLLRRYSRRNDPEPQPCTGRSANELARRPR